MALQWTKSERAAASSVDATGAADSTGAAKGAGAAEAIGGAREESGAIGEAAVELDFGCGVLFDRPQAGTTTNERNSAAAPKRMTISRAYDRLESERRLSQSGGYA